ncbi:MAG: sigma-54 interaction domain-containing protein [Mycobacterium leprae]
MEIRQLIRDAAPLLEALHDGVAVSDDRGFVVYVNEANTRITGLRADDLLNRKVAEVVPDSHLLDAIASGQPLIGVRTRVSGREVVSNIVPLKDGGQLIGAISVFRDVTEVMALRDQLREAHNTIALLKDHLSAGAGVDGVVVGRNPAAAQAYNLTIRAAGVNSPVLIEGESGTGKEVMARLIHARSDRAQRPFIAVNCAAVPATLLESELFGYDEGAFTGARRGGRAGLFEMADGGILFLDEVGDMEPTMQAKLLRVIQDGVFRRLGSSKERHADVRVVSATNRPLQELVAAHQFREDLYYRLRVIRVRLPALRERREDLPLFIARALERAAARLGRTPPELGQGALRVLMLYHYPGNIRELENLIEQAVVLDDDGQITEMDLPVEIGSHQSPLPLQFDQAVPTWDMVEERLLKAGLGQFPSKAALASHLGMSRATLYRKLAKYGLA